MRDYDENPIRVRSAFTREGVEKMWRNRGRAYRRRSVTMFLLCTLALGAYLLHALQVKSVPGGLQVGVLAGGMVAFFMILMALCNFLRAKRNYQKVKRRVGEGHDFTFFGGRWSSAQKSESYESKITREYSRIYSVEEDDAAFYVFISRGKVLIVQKAGIENAEPEELGALLRKAVKPSRYKVLVRPQRSAGEKQLLRAAVQQPVRADGGGQEMRDYDEDPIRVRSAFTWEGYAKMLRDVWRTRRRVLVAMIVLYGLAFFYFAFMTKNAPSGFLVSVFAGCISGLFLLFLRLRGTIGAKRAYQKAKRCIGEGYDFMFFSGKWSAAQKLEVYEAQIKVEYSDIYYVVEADDAFYVFTGRVGVHLIYGVAGRVGAGMGVFIVQKAGIENAEPQELGALLRKAVKPSLYKVIKVPVTPRR